MRKFFNKNKYILLGFFIPLLFFSLILIISCIYPFGDNSLCPYDAFHQYVPFLEEYKYKLENGESLFFSIRAGSSDFYLIWLYYLTSPINLLVLLFNDTIVAFNVIVILKICFISLSISYYLYKEYGKNDISIAVFSSCYSLSAYVIAYYYNIMWLDLLILFPWLIYSFKQLMNNKKKYLYPLLLSLTVFSNFYMSIQVCIFLCFYFILQDFKGFKDFLKKFWNFIIYSLLGGGMACVFYLPFLSIAGEKFKEFPATYFLTDFADLFFSFADLSNKNVDIEYASNANIFCGVLTLLFFILYLLNKNINKREKIKNSIIISFLFITMNISSLDYIMHGFYQPAGYMARYSYIMIFFIVCCAFESYHKEMPKKYFLIAALILSGIFLVCYVYKFISNEMSSNLTISICSTFVVIILFVIVKFFCKEPKKAICIIMLIELFFTGVWRFKMSDVLTLVDNKNVYSELKQNTTARETIDKRCTSNEEIFNNMNGMALFSSTLNKEYASFVYKLGLNSGANFSTLLGHTPIIDILFNMQYAYNVKDYSYYCFDEIDTFNDYSVYKNRYDTSYAYIVPKSILNWDYDNSNPFSNLNNFVGHYFNEHSGNTYIYDLVPSDDIVIDSDFEDITRNDENDFNVKFNKGNGEKITFETIAKDSSLSINIKSKNIDICNIYINDKLYTSYNDANENTISLYDLNVGDNICVEIKIDSDAEKGTISCNMAYFNQNNFEKFANDIISNRVNIDEIGDTTISGTYNYKEDSVMLISIPYSEGWKISNGNIYSDICLMATDIDDSGCFEINYITPLFEEGLFVSLIFITIYLNIIRKNLFLYIERKKQYENG